MDDHLVIALILVVILVAVDLVSGFAAAWATNTVQSSKIREGLWHKAGYAFVISAAMACEWGAVHGLELGFEVPLVIPICAWICFMEIVSILENAKKMNPELENVPGFERLKDVEKETSEPKHKAHDNVEEE